MALATICIGLATAFALYKQLATTSLDALYAGALVCLLPIREIIALTELGLSDYKCCLGSVHIVEPINIRCSLEAFDYYYHILSPALS